MTTTTTKATAAFNDDRDKLEILLERKIAIATDGLEEQFIRRLKHVTATKNIETICNYLIAMKAELNSSIMHKANILVYYAACLSFIIIKTSYSLT